MNKTYIVLKESSYSDIRELKYSLVTNALFQKIWCNFAHTLGFYGVKGYGEKIIGKGMNVLADGENFFIQGREKKGQETNNNLKIIFSNFKLKFISDSLLAQPPRVRELTPKAISSTNYSNTTDSTINTIKKVLFTTSDTTSVSSSNKIATDLGVELNASFNFPGLTSSTSIKYDFSYEYTFGNQEDITETKENSDQIALDISPRNKVTINLIANNGIAKCSFKALALILFNVTFDGYIKNEKNVYTKNLTPYDLNKDFSYLSYTFGNDELSAIEDLKQQIARKNIPDATVWNWNIFMSTANKYLLTNLPQLYNGFAYEFNGEFDKINSTNVVFEIGPNTPI